MDISQIAPHHPLHTPEINPFFGLEHLFEKKKKNAEDETFCVALNTLMKMNHLIQEKSSFFSCCFTKHLSSEEKEKIESKLAPKLTYLCDLLKEIDNEHALTIIQKAFNEYLKKSAVFFEDEKTDSQEGLLDAPAVSTQATSWKVLIKASQEKVHTLIRTYGRFFDSCDLLKEKTFEACREALNHAVTHADSLTQFNTLITHFLENFGPVVTEEPLFYFSKASVFQFTFTLALIRKNFPTAPILHKLLERLPLYARKYYETLVDAKSSNEHKVAVILALCKVGGISPVTPIADCITFWEISLKELSSWRFEGTIIPEALAASQYFDLSECHTPSLCLQTAIQICGMQSEGLKRILVYDSGKQIIALIIDIQRVKAAPLEILKEIELCLRQNHILPRIYLLNWGYIPAESKHLESSEIPLIKELLPSLFLPILEKKGQSLHAIHGSAVFPSLLPISFAALESCEELNKGKALTAHFTSFGMFLAAYYTHLRKAQMTHFFEPYFFNVLAMKHIENCIDLLLSKENPNLFSQDRVFKRYVENQCILAWLHINDYETDIIHLFGLNTSFPSSQALNQPIAKTFLNRLQKSEEAEIRNLHTSSDIESLRQSLLLIAIRDGRLVAASLIAKGALDYLGKKGWLELQAQLKALHSDTDRVS